MGDTPFIKFYPSDFLGGTSGLSPAERGVYITLLCLMYENNGPIQRHDARLSRRCGAPKSAFKKILDALIEEGKIKQLGDMLSNNRAEKALMDRTNRTQNATHAANQKWSAQSQNSEQNQRKIDAGASAAQCVGDAKPEARSQKPELENTLSNESDASASHDLKFWSDCSCVLRVSGLTDKQARTLLGKWTKERGRDEVRGLINQSRGSPDPVSYIEGCMKPKETTLQAASRKLDERRKRNAGT